MKIIIHADDEEASALLTQLATILTADLVQRLCGIDEKLDHLSTRQEAIFKKEKDMNAETQRLLTDLDNATNGVAAKLQALIDKADQAGSVTAAEINAALAPEVAKLQGLAADPADPVPTT